MSETNSESVVKTIAEPKLWAGKYKSAEEMENAIINKDKEYTKLSTEHTQLREQTKVPENYDIIDGIDLREAELNEVKEIARNAGLTQSQFEKTAREMESRIKNEREKLVNRRQSIGADKVAILEEYVIKNYPESVRDTVYNQILRDEKAMSDVLKHRDSLLNSQVPGMSSGNTSASTKTTSYDGQAEALKAAREYHKSPTAANRKKYIDTCAEVGAERYADKIDKHNRAR